MPCAHCKSEIKYFLFMDGDEVNSKRSLHIFWFCDLHIVHAVIACRVRMLAICFVIDRVRVSAGFHFWTICIEYLYSMFFTLESFSSRAPRHPELGTEYDCDDRIALPRPKPFVSQCPSQVAHILPCVLDWHFAATTICARTR